MKAGDLVAALLEWGSIHRKAVMAGRRGGRRASWCCSAAVTRRRRSRAGHVA
jgi:hypothetical protein